MCKLSTGTGIIVCFHRKLCFSGYVESILKESRSLTSSEAKSIATTLAAKYFVMFGRIDGKLGTDTLKVNFFFFFFQALSVL